MTVVPPRTPNSPSTGFYAVAAVAFVAIVVWAFSYMYATTEERLLLIGFTFLVPFIIAWVAGWKTNVFAVGLGLTALAAVAALWRTGFIRYGETEAPPDSITNAADSSQQAAVLEYARRLDFGPDLSDDVYADTVEAKIHGTMDRNILGFEIDSAAGPSRVATTRTGLASHLRVVARDSVIHLARRFRRDTSAAVITPVRGIIRPERDAHHNDISDLGPGIGPGKGRIVWRISIRGTVGYPQLGLPPGISYVWLDSLSMTDTIDTFGHLGRGRAVIIPADTTYRPSRRHLLFHRHRDYWWNRAMARWMGPGTYHIWGNCEHHGCCELL